MSSAQYTHGLDLFLFFLCVGPSYDQPHKSREIKFTQKQSDQAGDYCLIPSPAGHLCELDSFEMR